MAVLTITYFGGFNVRLDDQEVFFAYGKLRALLAYLALEGTRPVRREKLAGLLWPDQSSQAAQDSLRQALSKLRQAIGDRDLLQPYLLIERDTVQTNPLFPIWIDVLELRDLIFRIAQHRHRHPQTCATCNEHLESASKLCQGEFLGDLSLADSDLFEDWSIVWRERLHQQTISILTQLLDYYEYTQKHALAREVVSRWLEIEPWDEEVVSRKMKLLVKTGSHIQAINQYDKFCRRLKRELGEDPSPELSALYQDIKMGRMPFEKDGSRPRQDFYHTPTPLVGRSAELVELQAWLNDPDRRLISIVGPGGAGKTYLAEAVLDKQALAFHDGALFVPLEKASTNLASDVARALQAHWLETEQDDLMVAEYLIGKDLLLVLDGYDQVADGGEMVVQWLKDNPKLVVLATSRNRLGLAGEWVFGLSGLETPPATMVDQADQYSAVRLFIQSAQQLSAGFTLTPENRGAISEICRMVDGLPLAVSLAAAWVTVLPCEQIVNQIRTSLDFLATSRQEQAESHRSMRVVIDRSWQLLSDVERQVFPRLSVFPENFDYQAAREVTGMDLVCLAGLMEKFFVHRISQNRYDLHNLLHQYGVEKLAAVGEIEATQKRHFEYYLQAARENEKLLKGSEPFRAFMWLVQEQVNLMTALDWAKAGEPPNDEAGAELLHNLIHMEMHGGGIHKISLDEIIKDLSEKRPD